MFRRVLAEGEGLLFAEAGSSRIGTGIHMLFMFMPLGVVWLDEAFRVVDHKRALPWHPAYLPDRPARYTLEASVEVLDSIAVGDTLAFEYDT